MMMMIRKWSTQYRDIDRYSIITCLSVCLPTSPSVHLSVRLSVFLYTIEQRYKDSRLILMYKIAYDLIAISAADYPIL